MKKRLIAIGATILMMSGFGLATAGGASATPNPVKKGQYCYNIERYEGLRWRYYTVVGDIWLRCTYTRQTQWAPGWWVKDSGTFKVNKV